jgi:hypothetical protein
MSGSTNKNYPGAIDTFATWVDDTDLIAAHIVNDIQDQVLVIENTLGTNPQGSVGDLKSRLAISIQNDGKIKVDGTTIAQDITTHELYVIQPQGVTGIQGLQGMTGVAGATGVQGIQGNQGQTGIQGIQGITGLIGATGVQGNQGNTGVQGVQGNTGIQGIQGTTGVQGVQGTTGVQGIQGNTGVQGIQGNTGVQGIQGNTGVQGIQGITGLIGATGVQGIQGNTGIQGIQGSTGVQGVTGGAVLYTGIIKQTVTVSSAAGTAVISNLTYADNSYQVCLTPVGTNATACWAVVSSAKTSTGFTIALMTGGTNGSAPYNASVANVNIDIITVHA